MKVHVRTKEQKIIVIIPPNHVLKVDFPENDKV